MRRFIPALLLIPSLLSLFSAAAITIGYRQPESRWVDVLRLRSCAFPCWLGIVPGETQMRDAIARVQEVFGAPNPYTIRATYVIPNTWWEARIKLDDSDVEFMARMIMQETEQVQRIDLVFESMPRPTLPELTEILGRVVSVSATASTYSEINMVVGFEGSTLAAQLDSERCGAVRLNTPIEQIHFYGLGTSHESARWRGFGLCYLRAS